MSTASLSILVLMLPIWLGAVAGFRSIPSAWMARSNAFSGAFLFAVTVFLWIPELAHVDHERSLPWGIWIVLGYFLQFALDSRSRGLEHGHIHHHDPNPWPAYMGLLIHSVVEGVPMLRLPESEQLAFALSLGIHNLPIAALLAFWLRQCQVPFQKIALALLGMSLAAPFGAAVGTLLPLDMPGMEGFIGGLVVGIFLHVSSTILFELQKDHRLPTVLWVIVIIGLLSGFGLSQFIH
jgi:zinc and cadmium transporter